MTGAFRPTGVRFAPDLPSRSCLVRPNRAAPVHRHRNPPRDRTVADGPARWHSGRTLDRPENYHITLRFIGDIDDDVADEVAEILQRVRRSPFTITLTGIDVFGGKKPHSLWAGVSSNPELMALQGEHERLHPAYRPAARSTANSRPM
jgi:hypothetical protein